MGIAPWSSITGSVASVKTTTSSGNPELCSLLATYKLKPEALIESTTSRVSLETVNQARDREAHNTTYSRNLIDLSSEIVKTPTSSATELNPSPKRAFLADDGEL
ncbi:uncharacterized protein J3R85_005500 [Psidium guajava]|nr:uncharacterized protein J3R85_005500 [Psidium guajava]